MAARQIPEYTDAQLVREIERMGTKKYFPRTEETTTSWEYFCELVDEHRRREVSRGRRSRATGAPSWTLDAAPGTYPRLERVS